MKRGRRAKGALGFGTRARPGTDTSAHGRLKRAPSSAWGLRGSRASQEHQTNARGLDLGARPIVEVVLQKAVPDAELELLQELVVLHDVQGIEDIKILLLREDERVVQQLVQRHGCRHVPVGVGGLEKAVLLVIQNRER